VAPRAHARDGLTKGQRVRLTFPGCEENVLAMRTFDAPLLAALAGAPLEDYCADRDPEVHRVLTEKVFARHAVMKAEEVIGALSAS
jgi:hypothetical protein